MRRYSPEAEKNENDFTIVEAVGGWPGAIGVLAGSALVAFPAGSAFSPVISRWVPGMATVEGILALGLALWLLTLAWVLQAILVSRPARSQQAATRPLTVASPVRESLQPRSA